jgi:hypothetical protein
MPWWAWLQYVFIALLIVQVFVLHKTTPTLRSDQMRFPLLEWVIRRINGTDKS